VSKKWYNFFVVTPPSESPPEAAPETQSAPPRRAADLVADAEGDATFATPLATPADLAEIYDSAQITTPPHGYTVLKVADMLRSEHIRDLPPDVKTKSVMVALDAAGVKVAEIVEDAVLRDRALDTYERVLQKALEDLRARKELENQQIEEEINQRVAELRARIDQNNAETSREQSDLIAWRARKRQEEERIAEAIGYFVSPNPITTSAAPTKD
jgi:Asp-tRNA(Asn)/Glu-tRNA(Gln) amidotransferase A subunit family amidase